MLIKTRKPRKGLRLALIALIVALLIGSWVFVATQKSHAANATVTYHYSQSTDEVLNFGWDAQGSAAIGTVEGGLKQQFGGKNPQPTASMAKIITALVVLDKYDIAPDESGPIITIGAKDIELYNETVALKGSNLRVTLGQQLTLRNMLDGILLESANNLANSLANWAFGSMEAYHDVAVDWLADNELPETVIGSDASGFDAATTSSTSDLLKIAILAIQNPTIKQIVSQKTANFPGYDKISNTNELLGEDGFIGVKTGYTGSAGYCLLFADEYSIDDQTTTIVGVITGQANSESRFTSAEQLVESAKLNLVSKKVISKGEVVGKYETNWGEEVNVVAQEDISVIGWSDETPSVKVSLEQISSPESAGSRVGSISINDQTAPVTLESDLAGPNFIWRLFHVF